MRGRRLLLSLFAKCCTVLVIEFTMCSEFTSLALLNSRVGSIGGTEQDGAMSESTSPPSTPSILNSAAARILYDCVAGLFAAGLVVFVVVSMASVSVPVPGVVILAVWVSIISIAALPALGVLLISPPRVPLRERSALVASASWFGKAIWASLVFALSIVIGSIAGVVAAKASENPGGTDVNQTIGALSGLVLWPVVLAVAGVAYVVMGLRWLVDLGAIVDDQQGRAVRALLEARWRTTLATTPKHEPLVDVILEFSLGLLGRLALALMLLTVGVTTATYVASWF